MEIEKDCSIPVYGEVCLRKRRRKRQKKLLVLLFLDFAKNTTLHGLRYIAETSLHVAEKLFWLVTFFASVSICFYFIYNVWHKWQTSPVIVSFNAKQVSVDEVPFPSVTICPQVKFLQETFNYTEIIRAFNDQDNDNYTKSSTDTNTANILSLVCDLKYGVNETRKYLNGTDIDELFNIQLDINDIFEYCSWHGQTCDGTFFSKVLTKEGICFNFNGLMAKEILSDNVQTEFNYITTKQDIRNWTIDGGYTSKRHQYTYPFKGSINAGEANLYLLLNNLEARADKKCNALFSGYKIYLHHPADIPQALLYHFAAIPSQLTSMGVKFTMETANPELRDYPVEIRKCYFSGDRELKYYRQYTYNNCMLECLTNYTYKFCGCVAFYMPYHDSTKICSTYERNTFCLYQAEIQFTSHDGSYVENCKCLPACNSIQYDAEIHKTDYFVTHLIKARQDLLQSISDNVTMSRVDIFYKQPVFRSVHHSVLYDTSDFLGNCGGLLGLFLGFSWLSLVEIFYFLTFRVYKTIKTDLKNEKLEPKKN